MNPFIRPVYAAAGQLARVSAALVPAGESKVRRALRARRGIRKRFAAWGANGRDTSRPLLWMHAPSVGEGLQARPVLELARRLRPDLQLAYTFYSPSAERFAKTLDVDFADYLPFDTGGDAVAALDALRPSALVFAKLDVWPLLSATAARRRVKVGLVSATLSEGSSRRGPLARLALHSAYEVLDAVGAISDEDAARLTALGVRADRVAVTGDTRFDQAWRRAEAVDRSAPFLAPLLGDRFTLVAGSTWPADETVLLEAWVAVRRQNPKARLVIAPHEPTDAHLSAVEKWAAAHRAPLARLGDVESGAARDADVVLVDRVGVLAELYAAGSAAFVGGGFHEAGLHSVLEPAACGLPVCFGPRHTESRDAGLLLAAGGAATAATSRALAEQIRRWMTSEALRAHAGTAARDVVRAGLGADTRTWALIEGLLGRAHAAGGATDSAGAVAEG
ncbi:Three-deoxy-D-manno-octulosonic-acid transferase domain-containing protein [Gemmatirosa kalamazoonensis]|uniref:3-deoxy-D-manno-octulosonic acid transferase n=1 Tax=Gemmatirosa kalamazoonensis TaxID=861299 RepID=W0RL78_9BACT|nr:glycosyltransferase N-terminal domain-containing protein [Gemmatirosa kalamazoonensis]AHG90178.1 Three-deoxy-D-manno-octulosonic-acid transferase domain-containing protein [Gemmatirosa kalamazoonensis]